jgi:hypothetical protein
MTDTDTQMENKYPETTFNLHVCAAFSSPSKYQRRLPYRRKLTTKLSVVESVSLLEMTEYTTNEAVDMVLCYGASNNEYHAAVRLYQERFPARRQPAVSNLRRIVMWFRETGSVTSFLSFKLKTAFFCHHAALPPRSRS